MKNHTLVRLTCIIVLAFTFVSCSSESKPSISRAIPDVSSAKGFTVLRTRDGSIYYPSRKRTEIHVSSPAASFEERAHTVMKAAINLVNATGIDVAIVELVPSKHMIGTGDRLAIATYAPDGKGLSGDQSWTWEVESSDTAVDEQATMIAELWYQNNTDKAFQRNGMLDEPRLKAYIAKELGINRNQVKLPRIVREEYLVR